MELTEKQKEYGYRKATLKDKGKCCLNCAGKPTTCPVRPPGNWSDAHLCRNYSKAVA